MGGSNRRKSQGVCEKMDVDGRRPRTLNSHNIYDKKKEMEQKQEEGTKKSKGKKKTAMRGGNGEKLLWSTALFICKKKEEEMRGCADRRRKDRHWKDYWGRGEGEKKMREKGEKSFQF